MPQVDNTVFLSLVFSLFKWSTIVYGISLVYLFYPFVSKMKIIYNFLDRVKQIKKIFVTMFLVKQ